VTGFAAINWLNGVFYKTSWKSVMPPVPIFPTIHHRRSKTAPSSYPRRTTWPLTLRPCNDMTFLGDRETLFKLHVPRLREETTSQKGAARNRQKDNLDQKTPKVMVQFLWLVWFL